MDRVTDIESPEDFAERVRDAWVHDEGSLADVIASLIRARDSAVGAFAIERRDRDWILAMAEALGTSSGHKVPIVPETAPFRELFAAVRREAFAELAKATRTLAGGSDG